MLEQESPFPQKSRSILVAAGIQDERAKALIQILRNAELRVLYADTVDIAAHASEAAACVVVLRPDTWKTPTIGTILRATPDYLLPVLAEPMELPRGPWTENAITLADEPGLAEQELIQKLRNHLALLPPAPLEKYKQAQPFATFQPLVIKQRRKWHTRPVITGILLLLILVLGGSLLYRTYLQPQGKKTVPGTGQSSASSAPIPISYPSYTAKIPGANCDNGMGQWGQGENYIKNKVEIIDKYTTAQCQTDGTLVTRSGDYDVYSELFFDGLNLTSSSLANHYSVQVTATIVSGDAQADVTLDVHIPNQSYARYNFDINTLGHWEANIASPSDGSPIHRLAIGFLPQPSKTYTLAVEVNGPVMSFWLNGTKVTTVTDTTYPDNSSVAFGIADSTATKPISALFSNFQYQELAPTTLSQTNAIATATAQTSAQPTYTASIPGYDCDYGTGQWQPLTDNNETGTLTCQPTGMQLTAPGNTPNIEDENFYWLNGNFPENYKITAQIAVQGAGDGCAALGTRDTPDNYQYLFIVCADGSWEIALSTNTFQTLAQGWTSAQSSYQVTAMSDGSNQSLFINGTLIKTVNNTQLTGTDHVSLDVGIYQSDQPATAVFSNFSFTPLA